LGSFFFLKLFFVLSGQERRLILLSGLFFFSGAVLVELITGLMWTSLGYSRDTIYWSVMVAVEESLEMLGVAFFVYALLLYMTREISQMSFQFPSNKLPEINNFDILSR
jgi:hypothetical protein